MSVIKLLVFIASLALPLASIAQQDQSTFRVCFEEWEPYSYIDEQGKPAGYSLEFFNLTMKDMGVAVTFHSMPYARCIKDIENGIYDGILMGNDFPDYMQASHYSSGNWVISAIVRNDTPLERYEDMSQFNGQRWAKDIGYEYPREVLDFDGWDQEYEVSAASNIFQMLVKGRVDVYLEDELWAQQEIIQHRYPLKILQPPIVSIPQPAGFHNKHQTLMNRYDQVAFQLENTDPIRQLHKHYFHQ